MSQAVRYDQEIQSERYSQPFRSVARLISRFSEGKRSRRMVRKAGNAWFRLFCRPLGRLCVLPDVVVIGASKCGTSSLAAHLSSHPDCLPPFFKEVRYFDSSRSSVTDLDAYRAHFPTAAHRNAKELVSGRSAWTGDFSPTYYDHPHAPRRVFETLGADVKLILMVRNPVDRAFSQYRFQRGIGNEPEADFEKALELEGSRVAGEAEKQLADASYFSLPLNKYGYVTRSRYLEYIKNWHRYFDPSRLLIVRFEDFEREPQSVFDEICDFIEKPRCRIRSEIHNVSRIREGMAAETRARLVETFRAHNAEMSDYLARDFDWDR